MAERTNAAERYLLNEFSEEERTDFEAHMFDCPICGEQIRQGAIAIENLKRVLRERGEAPEAARQSSRNQGWAAWLGLPALLPSALALALGALVVYQNLAVIPGLERPQVLSSEVISPLAREAAPMVVIDRRLPKFNLNFEVDGSRAHRSYTCEFQRANGAPVLKLDCGSREVASFTLAVLLPTRAFPAGEYVMILRPADEPQIEVGRYSFGIQTGGHTT